MFQKDYELNEEDKLLLQKIVDGDIAFRKIEEFTDPLTAVKLRRLAIQEFAKLEFEHIQNFSLDVETTTKKNIENMIGAVQIPLGVAGLLKVKGEYANAEYYIPLATTEGALVASVNRGCSVITKSGGANVRIFEDEMTRAPVFKLDSLDRAKKFYEWVKCPEIFEQMKDGSRKNYPLWKTAFCKTLCNRYICIPQILVRYKRCHGHEHGDHSH